MDKKLLPIGLENIEENRRQYREVMDFKNFSVIAGIFSRQSDLDVIQNDSFNSFF